MTSPCTQESVDDLELWRVPAIEGRLDALENPPAERTSLWNEIDILRRRQAASEKRIAELEREVYNLLTRPGYVHIPAWSANVDPDWREKQSQNGG